jgi:hypothetical protein
MASAKQEAAARKNIKKAAAAAKRKRTIAHLPKKTRAALGKQAAKAANRSAERVSERGVFARCCGAIGGTSRDGDLSFPTSAPESAREARTLPFNYSFALLSRAPAYCPTRQMAFSMAFDLPETTSKIGGPVVKQFSIFLPNKVGALLEIVKLLATRNTHVVALSIAEQTDSAIAGSW